MIQCTSCGYHHFSPEIDGLQCTINELVEALEAARTELERIDSCSNGEGYNNPDMNLAIAKAKQEIERNV